MNKYSEAEFTTGKVKPRFSFIFIIILIVWAFSLLIFLLAGIELIQEDDIGASVFCLGFALLFSLPIINKFRCIRLSRKAQRIAFLLQTLHTSEIPAEELIQVSGMPGIVKDIEVFCAGGYLRDITYDRLGSRIIFPVRKVRAPKKLSYSCPNCGAPGTLTENEAKRCAYCNSPIYSFI